VPALITLTRLNGKPFVVNAELIRTIEERPDTTIVLVNGDTFIVKENMKEVVARAIEYARAVRVLQT
jgi:flagellar protein FlbD